MNNCVQCGAKGAFSKTEVDLAREVDGRKFSAKVPAETCGACGEDYFDGVVLDAFERALARRLVIDGASGELALRFMRKVMGMRAIDLAALLRVAPETISRWENGAQVPDRNSVALLGTLVLDWLDGKTSTIERLRALDSPPASDVPVYLQAG